jgi:hypothetical protein
MKNVIKCYAAAYSENGMIRYYFNRMPDGEDNITDITSFSKDKSVDSLLTHEQSNELKDILYSFIAQDNPYTIKESKVRGTCYRIGPYGYCIMFDLVIDIQVKL